MQVLQLRFTDADLASSDGANKLTLDGLVGGPECGPHVLSAGPAALRTHGAIEVGSTGMAPDGCPPDRAHLVDIAIDRDLGHVLEGKGSAGRVVVCHDAVGEAP